MDPHTVDVLALLALVVGFAVLAAYIRWVERVLGDPDHPDHEDAKAAIKAQQRENDLDCLRFE